MGEIVAAIGTCHTPYMFTRPPDENPEQLEQAGAAMNELGKVLDETKPDAILFLGADHVETFSVTCVPAFAIIAGNVAMARFAGREHNLPIHREMAEDILNKLVVDHNFDIAYSEDAELGHAFSIPFEYVIGKRNIPVIPFFTNVYVPPLPTPRRCEALGKALAAIVKGRKERVAIIASGGMSHFPGRRIPPSRVRLRPLAGVAVGGRQHRRAPEHDRHAARRGGQHRAAELGGDVRRHRQARRRADDYIPTWHHGLCMMRFLPHRKRSTQPTQAGEQFGGFKFKNEGFQFYKHPPSEAYGLNKLLFESRHSASLQPHRQRLREGGRRVRPARQQRTAALSMINVGKGGLVSEHVGPLAAAGAHPLQALMSLHVIFSTTHKRGQAAMEAAKH